MYQYDKEINAAQIWDILTIAAEDRESMTYGALADLINIHHRSIRYPLGEIFFYCKDNGLPYLTVLVHDSNGNVGQGFTSMVRESIEDIRSKVYLHPWSERDNPFGVAVSVEEANEATVFIKNGNLTDAVARVGNDRGNLQYIFRKYLLGVQKNQCPISCLTITLEACHIKPWSVCDTN